MLMTTNWKMQRNTLLLLSLLLPSHSLSALTQAASTRIVPPWQSQLLQEHVLQEHVFLEYVLLDDDLPNHDLLDHDLLDHIPQGQVSKTQASGESENKNVVSFQ